MKQQTFSDFEYSNRKRKTKREGFLEIMDEIIPWDEWVGVIMPFYPSGKRGRPPKGIELMLRMYLLQIWFNLSDEGTEDAIYDSYAMRKFVGINFLEEDVPDATTLLKFRRLLEQHGLNKLFFDAINRVMVETGHMLKGGTVVDATIINAPPSTKNAEKKRDPEMHQTKKGNEWRFGMKCHVGVDAFSGLVHTIEVTPANVHDIQVTSKLISMESSREDSQNGGHDRIFINADEFSGDYGHDSVDTYLPAEKDEQSKNYGHGGSDFYSMYYFIERILGDETADTIDVYEALDMFLPGMFAFRSILDNGREMAIPDLRDPAQRDKWRNDTACTDPNAAGDMLLPTCRGGTPDIPAEIYNEVRKKWEAFLEKREKEAAGE